MLITQGNRKQKSVWECDWCGKRFLCANNRASEATKKRQSKFCSAACRKEHWKKNASKRVVEYIKNNRHPLFKCGMGITTDGYVWILLRNKKRSQYKLHRYLMEIKIGRDLRPNEIVHHINGDKFDNRIENLEIVTISQHNREHGNLKAENRTDIWTDEEVRLVTENKPKKILHLLNNRTLAAAQQMRHRLKGGDRFAR